jgi:hypothetical protein
MSSTRRKVGAVAFGLVYGGSVVDGLNAGLGYVTGNPEYSVGDILFLGLGTYCLSTVLMGLLAGYVGRSVAAGSTASGIGAVLLVVAPARFFFGDPPASSIVLVTAATALGMGTIAAA